MREMILLMLSKKKLLHIKTKTKEEKPEEELKEYINNTLTFIGEKSEDINNNLFVNEIF